MGAVLSHRMEVGSEKPTSYVSHTLTAAAIGYSQLEKEGLVSVSAAPPMAVARRPMVQVSSGFCWSIYGSDVLGAGGSSF